MKTIELTQGKIALVCDCHYDMVKDAKWCYAPTGYAVRRVGGRKANLTQMHRVINGTSKEFLVDHENQNKLDNRCSNLRACTKAENMRNRGVQLNSKSGVKGVSWDKFGKRWHVQVTKDGKRAFSAYTRDLNEARQIQMDASKRLFGNFSPNGVL